MGTEKCTCKKITNNRFYTTITFIICFAVLCLTSIIGIFWGKDGLVNVAAILLIGFLFAGGITIWSNVQ